MKTNSISTSLAVHARTIAITRQLIFRHACLCTGFLAFATIVFGPWPAQAAVTEAWVQRTNVASSTTDWAAKVVRDAAGDIIVTGITAGGFPGEDMLTIKYSGVNGSVLWQQRYNSLENGDDQPSALAVDGSGNVVVAGSANGFAYTAKYATADGALLWEKRDIAGDHQERASAVAVDGSGNVVVTGNFYTAKYAAADGALLWEKRHGQLTDAVAVDGSGNVVVTGDSYTARYAAADGVLLWEKFHDGPAETSALAVDASGNVVVTGSSFFWRSPGEFYTAKYAAANGAVLWEKRYNSLTNGYDFARAVAVDGSGNVAVTGFSNARSGFGPFGLYPGGGDYYTAKYAAADGALLWENLYNRMANSSATYFPDFPQGLAVDASGNVVVTGNSWNGANDDFYTAKYAAADGVPLWEQRHNGSAPGEASLRAVAVDASGNVAVTGAAYHYRPDGSFSYGDYYTAKYAAADGDLLWEKRYNGPANGWDQAAALAMDSHGNVVVTGGSEDGTNACYTAKYAAADGDLLWEKRSPCNVIEVVVDGSGNVVVTGSAIGSAGLYTAKYAAADGALLWEKRYNRPGNDQASALALDGSGNVVVTGTSYTAKYAASDGALLWEKSYSYGYATAMAVDGSGNVVVTGYSWEVSNADYLTVKYAAADGVLLWEKRYNGPANGRDETSAVAVDGSGNVVVTGTSYNTNNLDDYYTAKYAAADGALLWEKRYNGPANGQDRARAVAVDGSGNVVVTGNSFLTDYRESDYYTAKYAAADGALLWEKRFSGPGGVGDSPHCLALGPDGMVVVTGSTSNGGYATVVYREVPEVVSINLISTGVRVRFSGVSGRRYNVERAPAVTGPWSTINTQTAPPSGAFEYLDTNPPARAAFYRASEP